MKFEAVHNANRFVSVHRKYGGNDDVRALRTRSAMSSGDRGTQGSFKVILVVSFISNYSNLLKSHKCIPGSQIELSFKQITTVQSSLSATECSVGRAVEILRAILRLRSKNRVFL